MKMKRILQRKLFHFSSHPLHSSRKFCFAVSFQNHKYTESSQRFPYPARASPGFAQEGYGCAFAIQRHFLSSQAQVNTAGPTAGIVEVPLAQTGEGIAECELLQWFVQEGDSVEEFQRLCEVQSDKATIEITSRYKGKVSRVRFIPGDIIKVGETLLELSVDESHSNTTQLEGVQVVSTDVESGETVLTLSGSPKTRENRKSVLSTPAVRHIAKECGVNVEDIPGTGKDGRVMKEDVLKYVNDKESIWDEISPISEATRSLEAEVMQSRSEVDSSLLKSTRQQILEDKSIPLRGFQRAMAKSMSIAAKVPHFHYLEEINVDSLAELKTAFQDATAAQGVKHTYLPFLIKSLSFALMEYPSMNSVFNEDAYEMICKGSHNIGVAMATTHGLVVPNIKNVQSLSIIEITHEVQRLVQGASNNKLTSEDVSGGTITISNIGAIGGKFGSPLLNVPEVAIIAIGRIQKLPRFSDDETVYPALVMNVTIGADHRVIDGAAVANFCNRWKALIENPEHLLLHLR